MYNIVNCSIVSFGPLGLEYILRRTVSVPENVNPDKCETIFQPSALRRNTDRVYKCRIKESSGNEGVIVSQFLRNIWTASKIQLFVIGDA